MIIANQFVIPHIPKTGGDAIKQIVAALRLPEVTVMDITDKRKHDPVDPGERDVVLSIRRLPARELSWLMHVQQCYGKHSGKGVEVLLDLRDGENEISRHLAHGVQPAAYIRAESLRSDLATILARYYTLTSRQESQIVSTPTKAARKYDHRRASHFTDEQIRELYRRSPTWSEHERRAYGDLLVEKVDRTLDERRYPDYCNW
jgi:hypothetical protein